MGAEHRLEVVNRSGRWLWRLLEWTREAADTRPRWWVVDSGTAITHTAAVSTGTARLRACST